MSEYQTLFNIAVTIMAFLCGWVLNNITKSLDRLDSDVRAMPTNYVSKDDYRIDIRDIKDMLTKLFERLDGKADK